MKMGIKEFRERISEVAEGDEVVVITQHGRRVGRYVPDTGCRASVEDVDAWLERRERHQEDWRARTPDWQARMIAFGLSPDGELIKP